MYTKYATKLEHHVKIPRVSYILLETQHISVSSSGSSVGRAVDCSGWYVSVIHRSLVQIRPGGQFFFYLEDLFTIPYQSQYSIHFSL